MIVLCNVNAIDTTLAHLREAGSRNCEGIVLWLGRRTPSAIHVEAVYRPAHVAREDMFHIPPASMTALQAELRQRRLMVAAQVHSHPLEAFHSRADDQWAIIRHEGALSLVIPYFASQTTTGTFLKDAKVYQFSANAKWTEVPSKEVSSSWLQIK
ncbi:Mov34/MPN/PAD-1 family protein [Dyella psychrodurans]|uniref:JAB domain-containing protein n=1 Tax=Dyella psychrodurans TaxID=1927960 RepID=A0A370X7T9_9GAMM|nr:Mov34/MPN/PAD-1 family protein [Dyella psychrodurans]RDS84382.1 hypothetical protein DWU99_10330 [Dyella psychrodurans]